MNRDEVLEKSRGVLRNQDVYEQEILKQASGGRLSKGVSYSEIIFCGGRRPVERTNSCAGGPPRAASPTRWSPFKLRDWARPLSKFPLDKAVTLC